MWIRLAKNGDFDAIVLIDASVCDDDYRRSLIIEGIQTEGCWIAGYTDVPAGYLVKLHQHFFGRDFVALLEVKPSMRRRGLPSRLFEAAEADSSSPQLFTSTNQSNGPMRALLEARGYRRAGMIDHLDKDDPELIFVRYLK